MQVQGHDRFHKPFSAETTSLVVYTDDGEPICVALQLDDNTFHVCHFNDPEFSTMLVELGVKRVIKIKTIDKPPLAIS